MQIDPTKFRNDSPLGVVRVLWLCMEIQPGSIGELEYWPPARRGEPTPRRE
jgi:hypothetical protein